MRLAIIVPVVFLMGCNAASIEERRDTAVPTGTSGVGASTAKIDPANESYGTDNKKNEVVNDIYSPNRQYHVEVRECHASGSLVASDKEKWANVIEAGKSGSCRSSVGMIAQFKVPHPEDKLELEWASDTLLKAWHPNFDPTDGPMVRLGTSADDPVKVLYAQKNPQPVR